MIWKNYEIVTLLTSNMFKLIFNICYFYIYSISNLCKINKPNIIRSYKIIREVIEWINLISHEIMHLRLKVLIQNSFEFVIFVRLKWIMEQNEILKRIRKMVEI
jgi:hypothetical protein